MQDAWRAYLELALGLTEASRKKARQVAGELVGRGEATAAQAQTLVDDLISTSRTNREGLARLVRYEVDRALGAVGLATADEVADLTARLRDLERRLNEPGTAGAEPSVGQHPAAGQPGTTQAPAARAAAEQPGTKPAVAEKTVAKKAVAKKAVAKKSAAKKSAAKQTGAKKTAAKKTVASKRDASRTRKATG